MVDTADGPMMLVPILPPAAPAQADASRSSGAWPGLPERCRRSQPLLAPVQRPPLLGGGLNLHRECYGRLGVHKPGLTAANARVAESTGAQWGAVDALQKEPPVRKEGLLIRRLTLRWWGRRLCCR